MDVAWNLIYRKNCLTDSVCVAHFPVQFEGAIRHASTLGSCFTTGQLGRHAQCLHRRARTGGTPRLSLGSRLLWAIRRLASWALGARLRSTYMSLRPTWRSDRAGVVKHVPAVVTLVPPSPCRSACIGHVQPRVMAARLPNAASQRSRSSRSAVLRRSARAMIVNQRRMLTPSVDIPWLQFVRIYRPSASSIDPIARRSPSRLRCQFRFLS